MLEEQAKLNGEHQHVTKHSQPENWRGVMLGFLVGLNPRKMFQQDEKLNQIKAENSIDLLSNFSGFATAERTQTEVRREAEFEKVRASSRLF